MTITRIDRIGYGIVMSPGRSSRWRAFFFFQAEDGIRDADDWSSDVCSSDLSTSDRRATSRSWPESTGAGATVSGSIDRKSVGEGKSVDLGGRRIIKKKKQKKKKKKKKTKIKKKKNKRKIQKIIK